MAQHEQTADTIPTQETELSMELSYLDSYLQGVKKSDRPIAQAKSAALQYVMLGM
jgi:hypothetical protein